MMASSPSTTWEARDLWVRGAQGPVLRGVTVSPQAGQILGVVGESGSGKSTLGLALMGFMKAGLRATGGSVDLDGRRLLTLSSHEAATLRRTKFAYVPQNPGAALNPNLRLIDALRLALPPGRLDGPQPHRPRGALAEVAETVRLPAEDSFWRRYPHEVSGGQQQRVLLALVLLRGARYVVFDEPTTGLDVLVQRQVLDTIREVTQAHNLAGVFISHDLAVVNEMADALCVLYSGQVVEAGPASDVLSSAAHPYTRALMRAVLSVNGRTTVRGIPGRPLAPASESNACRFLARCQFAQPACGTTTPQLTPVASGHEVRCLISRETIARTDAYVPSQARPLSRSGDAPVALSVRGLSVRIGDKAILSDVDIDAQRGTTLAIVGESGAGKTTLARCLAGLIATTGGHALLAGETLDLRGQPYKRNIEHLRAIQYVFQNPYTSLNPRRTVRQTLSVPFQRFHRRARTSDVEAELATLLADVSLDRTYLDRLPKELSGGERQRLAIARALAAGPDLLICDEPTSALDVSVQASVLNLLMRLRDEHELTLIIVTHDLAVVRLMADTVVVLRDGEVVDAGSTSAVLARETGYAADLRRAVPMLATQEGQQV